MSSFPGMRTVPLRDRAEFNLVFILRHFIAAESLRRRQDALRARIVARIRQGGPGRVTAVERVKTLLPGDFERRFLRPGVPVVIEKGAAAWPLATRWSFENFKASYGDEKIKLVQREGLVDDDFVFDKEYSEEIGFGDFLDQVLTGGRKYMRFSPLLERFPALLEDFDQSFFRAMTGNRLGHIYQVFIGGVGSTTPLHNAMSPFFFVNVCGVKRWTIIPNHFLAALDPATDGVGYNHSAARFDIPDVERYPGTECVDRLEAVLEPGDILYLPSWMWHCVKNDSPTIGVRCGFINARNVLFESSTLTFLRVFAARNPTMLEALYHMLIEKNLPQRDRYLLNPALIRK